MELRELIESVRHWQVDRRQMTLGLVGLMCLWGVLALIHGYRNPQHLSISSLHQKTAGPDYKFMSPGGKDHDYVETQGLTILPNKALIAAEADTQPREMELGEVTKTEAFQQEANVALNDPSLSQKWGLEKSDAQRAWRVTRGSRNIVVAIIDTGIDESHPDLRSNLWVNPGENGLDFKGRNKRNNGIDDDGNGFVDDVHGWNFVENNKVLTDNHGHGTHIAGIIGAEGGNRIGTSGVAPQVSLMVLKYYDPNAPGDQNLENTVRAIRYAVKMKAHIINYSGGGLEFSRAEYEAIAEARKKNILVVAAAGNEQSDSDKNKYYPADYDLDNIISVTAINQKTQVLASSNYGVHTVDLAAPGEDIYSTLPGGSYGIMTGTSQATAFVSGLAALILSNNDEFKPAQLKKYILSTGDHEPHLRSKTGTSRRLNLYKALVNLDSDVSANGVIAENTRDIGPFSIGSPSSTPTQTSRRGGQEKGPSMINFGKSLLENLGASSGKTAP